MKNILPSLFIAISAAFWGMIAIFVRKLADLGFSPMEIVAIRVLIAALLLGSIGVIKNRHEMKIRFRDVGLFIGTGIFSIALFNWCYFKAMNQMNLSMAVILLYTAPAFVTVLSFLFLKEVMSTKKIMSVIGTMIGCVLIAGVSFDDAGSISAMGVIIGLGAGFGYALYTIIGKFALKKYQPFTVTFYTFLVASFALVPLTGLWRKGSMLLNGEVLFYGIGLGLVPTVISYLLYTKGLEKVDGSKASIIATVEPLVATILSVFLYHEGFGLVQMLGSILIIVSVTLVNINLEKRLKKAPIH